MGAGIARTVRQFYPMAYEVDKKTSYGDKNKLGTYSCCKAEHHYYDRPITIVNAYTQFRYGRDRIHADYGAIRDVMKKINNDFEYQCLGMPKIGAGLGGGNWNIIKSILDEVFKERIIYVYTKAE
jgi:O-acetyl-ADP-ribose deacetylase (regulator of RNase III)